MNENSLTPSGPDEVGAAVTSNSLTMPATMLRQPIAGYPRNQDTDPQTLASNSFVKAILHWWKFALIPALLLSAGSCVVVWYLFEPVFQAKALIQIQEDIPFVVTPIGDTSDRFVATQIEILRSPLVLGPVVSKPEIARLPEVSASAEPIESLAEKIRVTQVGASELFQVSCQAHDPAGAALLTNAIIDSFFELRDKKDTSRARRVIQLLDEEKARREREVARLREKVLQLGKSLPGQDPFLGKVGNPFEALTPENQALATIQKQLTTTEVDRQILEAQISAFEEFTSKNRVEVSGTLIENALGQTPEIQELMAVIQNRRLTMQQVEATSARGKQDPAYLRVKREIERYNDRINELRESLRDKVKKELEASAALQQKDELANMKVRLDTIRIMEEAYRTRYEDQIKTRDVTGTDSLEFQFAQAELAREETVHGMIANRVMTLQTEQGAGQRVELLTNAAVPTEPVESIPWKQLGLAAFVSFCFPFGLAILWEQTIQRISTADQLAREASVSVVGEITRLPMRGQLANQNRNGAAKYGVFEESIDSLRTCIVLAREHADISVLAVASAVSGEGKTSVASQLAVSIARSSATKTLLIDADMRQPDIHRIFQIDNKVGLSQLLDGRCTAEEAIVTNYNERLHILPAGHLHINPHKLVGDGALKRILNELRATYEYIVIDTPPILSASESLVVAKEADGVLLCTMRDFSRRRQISMAYDRLVSTGARPIGAVLNGVPTRSYATSYGRYQYPEA